jgi:hypothetical protein
MKNDLDEIYRPLVATLILGILFATAFTIYMRWQITKSEGFSELYFNNHKNLHNDMRVNNTYNISFTFTNHELKPETYVYEVDSETMNETKRITISVGESATILLQATPLDRTWNLTGYVETVKTEKLNVSEDGSIMRKYMITGYGEILHENITVEELKGRSISTYKQEEQLVENMTRISRTNQTLKASNQNIIMETTEKTIQNNVARKPFTIKVYKEGAKSGEELEIHYWYEARE